MNLTRKYKISKILNKPLTGKEAEIMEYLNSCLDVVEYTSYPNIWIVNYMKDNKLVFQIDYNDNVIRYNLNIINPLILLYNMSSIDFITLLEILSKPFITSNKKDFPVMAISAKYFENIEQNYTNSQNK